MSKKATKVVLKNVRLSYPHIFKRSSFNGVEGKYEATFLIDKKEDKTNLDILTAEIKRIRADEKFAKVSPDKICLRDGDNKDDAIQQGNWVFKASNNRQPVIVDANKAPVEEDTGLFYGGCYVNVCVSLWGQDNNFGKRINANLLAIQFSKDGDRFGTDYGDVTEGFIVEEGSNNTSANVDTFAGNAIDEEDLPF